MKLANVTPVSKKGTRTSKNNYRSVSILPILSKLFERLISKQLSGFFESILSKFQCGFRKGYGAQQCLLMMLETWKEATDSNKVFGALLTDLLKVFDCLSRDLLIAKLHAYGLDLASLKILQDYLTNRKQRTKVDSFYSSWEKILSGVPQGSTLGPLFFNIFMCDIFLISKTTSFTGYADDNTPFVVRVNATNVIKALEDIGENLIKGFSDNQMKLKRDKGHVLLNSQGPNTIKEGNLCIKNSSCKKMLGINFHHKLKFTNYIDEICKKASRKLNALARTAPYMGIRKQRTLMNAFFKSQFNYCPLLWMCCNRSSNNKIDRLHGRSLLIVYTDKTPDFSELVEKDGSVSVHYQNIRQLATEMFKVSKGLCPEIVKGLLQFRNKIPYNLRQRSQFHIPPVRTVFSGKDSFKFLGPKIWELIPDEMKELESLWEFKRAIKLWKPTSCPCRLCKQYFYRIAFL